MKTRLTRIHLGLGMGEVGLQFEMLDDGGSRTSTQRAFVVVDEATIAPVWLAAQAALESKLAALPLDLPPGSVTTALMQQRTAEAAAARAVAARQAADEARLASEAANEALDIEIAAGREELEKLRAERAGATAPARG